MDRREKRAVNDMATALKRIVEVLERGDDEDQHRAKALVYSVGKAILAVKRIGRREDKA